MEKIAKITLAWELFQQGGATFLKVTMPRRFGGFVQTIQTGGGSEFDADAKEARLFCRQHSAFESMRPPLTRG